ncbi:MAG: hypothetical protein AAGD04_03470 [Pseudomonadota bacterium]
MSMEEASIARVLTAADFAKAVKTKKQTEHAQSEAAQILAAAQAEAEQIVRAAEAKAAENEQRLKELSDQSLERFLNEDAVDATARALAKLMDQTATMRNELDDAKTWIVPIVRTAFKRIIGTLPTDDVLTGAIEQSLGEVRERWDLVLRCHPSLQRQIASVIEENPRLSGAIREVQMDRTLQLSECQLVSGQGVLDIGVDTQMETFLRALEQLLDEPQASTQPRAE